MHAPRREGGWRLRAVGVAPNAGAHAGAGVRSGNDGSNSRRIPTTFPVERAGFANCQSAMRRGRARPGQQSSGGPANPSTQTQASDDSASCSPTQSIASFNPTSPRPSFDSALAFARHSLLGSALRPARPLGPTLRSAFSAPSPSQPPPLRRTGSPFPRQSTCRGYV